MLFEPRAYMNVNLLQQSHATVDETMRCLRLDHDDIAGLHIPDEISDHKSRIPFLDHDDFIVFVEMQGCALAWRGFDQEHRNPDIPLFRPDKIV